MSALDLRMKATLAAQCQLDFGLVGSPDWERARDYLAGRISYEEYMMTKDEEILALKKRVADLEVKFGVFDVVSIGGPARVAVDDDGETVVSFVDGEGLARCRLSEPDTQMFSRLCAAGHREVFVTIMIEPKRGTYVGVKR